jgi:phosphonate transport system substrate-binding protein
MPPIFAANFQLMKKYLLVLLILFSAAPSFSQTLRMAVYQYADNPRIKNLQPLADHLQQQFGITTSVKSYPTVHALITAMQQKEVDMAFISTFGYLLLQAAEQTSPMLPVAALVAPGASDNYKTAIVSRKAVAINSLDDIKKQGERLRFAFVAKGSTSGNLVPRLLLNGLGIKEAEQHFASVVYAGTHARAIDLLLKDSADVAAMGSTEWDKLEEAKKQSLQLLHLSSEIPLGPVLINKEMEEKLRGKIIQGLLELHQTNGTSLAAIKAAWTEAKQATHFISIQPDYYVPYLQQFGKITEVEAIIRQFIQ